MQTRREFLGAFGLLISSGCATIDYFDDKMMDLSDRIDNTNYVGFKGEKDKIRAERNYDGLFSEVVEQKDLFINYSPDIPDNYSFACSNLEIDKKSDISIFQRVNGDFNNGEKFRFVQRIPQEYRDERIVLKVYHTTKLDNEEKLDAMTNHGLGEESNSISIILRLDVSREYQVEAFTVDKNGKLKEMIARNKIKIVPKNS